MGGSTQESLEHAEHEIMFSHAWRVHTRWGMPRGRVTREAPPVPDAKRPRGWQEAVVAALP
jgi:hypothetical protein